MASENTKVSVVIPCFNGAQHIESCLANIGLQTYKNIEVIIVDDASTDNSKDIIEKLSKIHKIKSISNKYNIGAHDSVNQGYAMASGVYVTHLDIDDSLPVYAIESRIRLIEDTDSDFVLTAEEVRYDGNTRIVYPCHNIAEVSTFLSGSKNDMGINTHAYLARRNKVLLHGGRPYDKNRHHGDYAFVLKMITETKWAASDEVTYNYNRADGVLSKNMKHKQWQVSLSEVENYYSKQINS